MAHGQIEIPTHGVLQMAHGQIEIPTHGQIEIPTHGSRWSQRQCRLREQAAYFD